MALWLILTLMTTAVLAAIAWPFAFGGAIARSGSDVAVYRDQLIEIDRDREAGLIGTADAEGARIEISRRLLRATEVSDAPEQPLVAGKKVKMRRLASLAMALVFLPTLAAGTYLRLGSPNVASIEEIAAQAPSSSDDASVEAMVAQVERHLKGEPNDGEGWEVLGPVYMRLGRYEDSVRAWQNAIANLGDSVDREENLGESLVAAANGVVTGEASTAFDKALSIDNNSVIARFYVGLAAKQRGRRDEAAKIWRQLIAGAPPDADWVDSVRNELARIDEPSVTATDKASPSNGQQEAMIKSMVERLSERLKANGEDPDAWLRLVHSYNVMGDRNKADAAVTDARRALASDPKKLARLEEGLKNVEGVPQEAVGEAASTIAASPQGNAAAIQSMVDGLAERLKNEGGNIDSWLMLVRSYQTLGDREKAEAAAAQTRLAFAADPEKLSRLDQLLRAADSATSTTPKPEILQRPGTRRPAVADAASTETQAAIIKGMVDRLAERLKQDGHDVDGWIKLMRSYVVLGRQDQASAAGKSARTALGNDPEALRRLSEGAKELGIDVP
jgi:cytochrome c-type biogenesis protein CcmH